MLSWVLAVWALAIGPNLSGQEPKEPAPGPTETESGLVYQRKVQLPQGSALPGIIMTEFFSQGALEPRGANLAVYDNRNSPVPWRILQSGPGDFCRIAFQIVPRQHVYKIYYGGKVAPPKAPEWTNPAGLLLETRHWQNCDLNQLFSLRDAWNSAETYGTAYVPSVFHRFNPFAPAPEPFLSLYRGMLRVSRAGTYRFFTSSQDCSFLQIDGHTVVAAPGWHGPVHDSRLKGEINLTSGTHEFEYWHAAAGADACMVAAWQPPGSAKPEAIPPSAFGSEIIAEYPTTPVKHPRDYAVEIGGEVPLAESKDPLVRVQFRTVARSSGSHPKLQWEFGDGQTSTLPDPVHIYLAPGVYKVTLKSAAESDALAVVNRVPIHRALVFADERHPGDQLAAYLPVLDRYNAAVLDPRALLQLVRAFDQANLPARAVKAGQAGLLAQGQPTDSEEALSVVRLVGSLLRDRIGDSKAALAFWNGAVKAFRPDAWKAECEIEAADLSLSELLQAEPAKKLLDSAAARLGGGAEPALAGRLQRVLGDWYARKGDKASARAAYSRAMTVLDSRKSAVEQDAWRGALSRSTEEFLRSKDLDRAWSELRKWQEEFPIDKIEGDLTLLQTRCWMARSRWAVAAALAGDLVAINPDSPYADRLVFLGAECEERLGHSERAQAAYQSLLTDYPGSPLVKEARRKTALLTTEPSSGGKR
jgi:TolA-binding protein